MFDSTPTLRQKQGSRAGHFVGYARSATSAREAWSRALVEMLASEHTTIHPEHLVFYLRGLASRFDLPETARQFFEAAHARSRLLLNRQMIAHQFEALDGGSSDTAS